MLILDSNVWIYAVTANERPVEVYTDSHGSIQLFEDFVSERFHSIVTPYMAAEIERGCRRSERLPNEEVETALSAFYGLIGRCDSIKTPFEDGDFSVETLVEHRIRPCNRLVGELLDVQTKDVPILLPAYDNATEKPVILTDDGGFARLEPGVHGISGVTVEGLELAWTT